MTPTKRFRDTVITNGHFFLSIIFILQLMHDRPTQINRLNIYRNSAIVFNIHPTCLAMKLIKKTTSIIEDVDIGIESRISL
jgi:hypothetical protein